MVFNIRNILLIFVFSLCLIACGTTQAPCFKSNMSKAEIFWGNYSASDRKFTGYMMDSFGRVYNYQRDASGIKTISEFGKLEHKDACRILGLYYWVMKTVQTCNEPGNNLEFLTFINDETNTVWNVIWNSGFKTEGNKNLKKVSDSIDIIFKRIEKN